MNRVMKMDLLQLRYFYKIAHTPTLTQAARELHVSQPSLSKMIRDLEYEFGVKLFSREGRNLRLNDKGMILLGYATDILNSIESLRNELQVCRDREDMELRVGVFAASPLFPRLITKFRTIHPNIKINMVMHSYEHNLSENPLDMVLSSSRTPPSSPFSTLLIREDILLAVPKNHLLAQRKTVSLQELQGEEFISMSREKTFRAIMDQYCAEAGISPNIILESDDPFMTRNLIASGFGIAFFPQKTWMHALDSSLSLVRITDPPCVRYIYSTVPRNTFRSTASRLFQEYLREFFQKEI